MCVIILIGGGGHDLYAYVDGFMKAHPKAGGIAINWLMFGSNGHISKPEGGVLKNYTTHIASDNPVNLHVKTICDPMKVLAWAYNPHNPIYRRGFYALSENGEIIRGPFSERVSFDKIRINHYYSKSQQERMAKIKRGRATININRSTEIFERYDHSDVSDTEILSCV